MEQAIHALYISHIQKVIFSNNFELSSPTKYKIGY